ncbi:DUF5954 family protein [Streptomyces sp. yr375]|uniref:DUF5954 family protein n=1 Tax=Streptomyces sp. yr375 TaxID=1761906 RepID=UPI00210A090E|nr:DUF5954 family protein [Streptomyces sp. yr375]
MTDYRDVTPSYLTFRVTAQEGPIAAFAEQEAWEATQRYPQVMGLGLPEFFYARECETGGWEILGFGSATPQDSRDSLGSLFRLRSVEAGKAGDETGRRKWMAAALRMDREVVNEIRVRGERFRIIRTCRFLRMGPNGPEPPRPSDRDALEVGDADMEGAKDEGFIVDPYTSSGLSDSLLKLQLLEFASVLSDSTEDVVADSRRARIEYPGGVLLPAVFMISERENGQWLSFNPGCSYTTPQGARDSLAGWLRVQGPFKLRLDEERKAEYARLADRLDETRSNVLTVDGIRYRVSRVERLIRIGPDGPEGPRPSDYDPEPPIEVQNQQLRDQGLEDDDEEDDGPTPLSERAQEYLRLFEAERERREKQKQQQKEQREQKEQRRKELQQQQQQQQQQQDQGH